MSTIVGEYTTEFGTACVDYENSYLSFNEAHLRCSSDTKCIGIYDYKCDNMIRFTACYGSIHFENNRENCVYKKTQHHGECSEFHFK